MIFAQRSVQDASPASLPQPTAILQMPKRVASPPRFDLLTPPAKWRFSDIGSQHSAQTATNGSHLVQDVHGSPALISFKNPLTDAAFGAHLAIVMARL